MRGRPRIVRAEETRQPMSTRIRGEIFNALSVAADQHDRALGHEVEIRLEASFRQQDFAQAAFGYAFGPQTAAVLELLAEVLRYSANHADWVMALASTGDQAQKDPSDWLDDPDMFEIVARNLHRAIEALRPPEEPSTPLREHGTGFDLTQLFDRKGAGDVLKAIADPANAPQKLRPRAQQIADALGTEIVERLARSGREQ
jgi:hypothetical protein